MYGSGWQLADLERIGAPSALSEDHVKVLFDRLNNELPCPPFSLSNWDACCVCCFKDTPPAQVCISVFRDPVAILEDADFDVGTLTTERPETIVSEDDYQIVAKSGKY